MRASLSPLLVVAAAAVALLSACGGGKNNKPSPTPAAGASAAPTRQSATSAAPALTPLPARSSAVASVASAGTPGANGCLTFPLLPLDTSNLPTQAPRPAVQIPQLTLPESAVTSVLPGFKPDDAGQYNPQEQRTANDIVQGTANPQAAAQHLQQIGFLGGRQQGFTGPQRNGAIATVTVQHFVFNSDAGASNFLHAPVISAIPCVMQQQPPSIGQEANAFSYTAPAAQTSVPFAGFSVGWRCGRVFINVSVAGAPGLYTLAQTSQIAQKVQAAFLQAGQPCA
ncbi:MAG TPA: hypothetical protein VKV26_12355 [Dehalococcoidia bacterium]|nr:hypothetical protein [Dehalococcoidia bacterium]